MIFTPLYVIIEITPDIGRKSAMHEKVIDFLNSNETKQTFPGINGSYRMFDKSSIVGYCHCTTHKGVLDISDMNRHDCIKKAAFILKNTSNSHIGRRKNGQRKQRK